MRSFSRVTIHNFKLSLILFFTGTYKEVENISRHYAPIKEFVRPMCSQNNSYGFNTVRVSKPCAYVLSVEINRPEKRNAMTFEFWKELGECFKKISMDKECRAVVLSGSGKMFSAGIDFNDLSDLASILQSPGDVARKATSFYERVRFYQESFDFIEKCPKPVIAAIHGGCIGAGVDLIAACDIRYCSQDAFFQVKEVDIGIAADLGTLQRLPKIVGSDSYAREMIYTSKKVESDEGMKIGLVSKISTDKDTLMTDAFETAKCIASKSPVAVQGSKINILYSRDHSVHDGLEFNVSFNLL
ncbi:Delta(3,5)-Delta(2,4)-dienoyl-CoA isomerase, mitochondrial [Nymphon striatum]|nr:Delta(3,5)-Delta(2,4)-dienoyl-CoA isomerase, mitochondrial [Nymphon striatum]